MKRSGIILFSMAVLMLVGGSALAWQPSGWVYHMGDYAYSQGDAEWYYFNSVDTQWRVNLTSGAWDELTDATGWNYHQWPYAYSSDTGDWYWFNVGDEQWCIGMTSGQWSKFGEPLSLAGMTLIAAGSFNMGDSFGDGFGDELPVHAVNVSEFYMDTHEVSKVQWDEVVSWAASNGYDITLGDGIGKAAGHPLHTVTWHDCVKWCNARSEKEGLTPCYTTGGSVYRTGDSVPDCNWSADAYRLPTEAEWEKAARGGQIAQRFPWGDTIQHVAANYYSSSLYSYDTSATRGYHPDWNDSVQPYTSPVGTFESGKNGYGLYDMTGNVWEWCWDLYGNSYYALSPGTDPRGAASGSYRVLRSGDWESFSPYCRVAARNWASPAEASGNGFRSVR